MTPTVRSFLREHSPAKTELSRVGGTRTDTSIVLIGTLDTKDGEIEFAKQIIENGVDVHVVDAGVMGQPELTPDTAAAEVAEAGGGSLDDLRANRDRGAAMDMTGRGAAEITKQLYMGIGRGPRSREVRQHLDRNGGHADVADRRPKFMVSTVASGDVEPYVARPISR